MSRPKAKPRNVGGYGIRMPRPTKTYVVTATVPGAGVTESTPMTRRARAKRLADVARAQYPDGVAIRVVRVR